MLSHYALVRLEGLGQRELSYRTDLMLFQKNLLDLADRLVFCSMRPTALFQFQQSPFQQMVPVAFAVYNGPELVEDICNPIPGWEPTNNPPDVAVQPGCRAYPEISTKTGYYSDPFVIPW
eukprot:CAMPEP_0172160244 /NCGR_PEP_ID=MMETSP1050-20130122/5450_1 /TAXON_ID=233186 /ORGANISM="Cryptomonas curvata, Strain CCAP979/52" /LENGTH=119 /DNA_ID=CAMNT_0012829985 /DNA_START=139 /DNA_END=499 /DNA_ORIENTATION=+